MKKICVYLGSKKTNSNGKIYIEKLIKKLKIYGDFSVTYLLSQNLKIHECSGCEMCFNKGLCNLDETDDMKKIKSEFLTSDIVIFVVPVFLHAVPGNTKIMLDRLAYWAHIFRLANKPIFIVTTSASNGNNEVELYLKEILDTMGAHVIGQCSLLQMNDFYDEKFAEHVELIRAFIFGSEKCKSNFNQETIFEIEKDLALLNQLQPFEMDYWKENKLLDCEDYNEYLKMIQIGEKYEKEN